LKLDVNPLSDALGAEIIGADLTRWEDDAQYEVVHRALLEFGVVVLRDQIITPAQQIAFSRRFGPLEQHSIVPCRMPGHPEILLVSNRRDDDGAYTGLPDAGRSWHSDSNFHAKPSLGSLLYALEVPLEGGDTLFANMTAAYAALDPDLKARAAGRKALYVYGSRSADNPDSGLKVTMTSSQWDEIPQAAHPLLRIHPETGGKSIYLSLTTIDRVEGLSAVESDDLVAALLDHFTQPAFVYRHRWRLHDIVFWDNRCINHKATPFDDRYGRHMHRTTISSADTVEFANGALCAGASG
jgi:taurine dioxygenase